MSVIVMGMEMPVSGTKYRVVEDLEGNKYLRIDSAFTEQYFPIRLLPEKHGRLIDADAFIGTIRPIVEEDDYAGCTFRTVKELMTEHIDEAQTIVEAEGE